MACYTLMLYWWVATQIYPVIWIECKSFFFLIKTNIYMDLPFLLEKNTFRFKAQSTKKYAYVIK